MGRSFNGCSTGLLCLGFRVRGGLLGGCAIPGSGDRMGGEGNEIYLTVVMHEVLSLPLSSGSLGEEPELLLVHMVCFDWVRYLEGFVAGNCWYIIFHVQLAVW